MLPPQRLLVVANAAAGGGDAESTDAAVQELRRAVPVDVAHTRDPTDLEEALDRRNGRDVVVAGGDGSLHLVVQALHRRRELGAPVLGLVPLGTGNDLARALGIPLGPAEAARVVLGGAVRALDLLVDDAGGVVVNAVHVGVGAEASRKAASWKARLGKAAYAAGSVVAGTRSAGWRLRVVVDGAVVADVDRRILMVGIGNGTSIGGGSPLTPDASPSDGLADVVVSEATGPLARLGYAVRLRTGRHVERADVGLARGEVVTVGGQAFPVNADGEVAGPVRRRTWAVHAGAWRLRVPG
jgi:YegS/Rv2252/BmrU family lipid kinase